MAVQLLNLKKGQGKCRTFIVVTLLHAGNYSHKIEVANKTFLIAVREA